MSLSFDEKLIKIYDCIERSCNSSVRLFDKDKGHSSKSVGFTAYEERQKLLKETTLDHPDVIEFLCRKGSHDYFKFEGSTIKIVSSTRETLGKNVFAKNIFEKDNEFESFDPLRRVIYKADYNLDDNEVVILECHYLEIERNNQEVIKEVNILRLANAKNGYLTEVNEELPAQKELPAAGLLGRSAKDKKADTKDQK